MSSPGHPASHLPKLPFSAAISSIAAALSRTDFNLPQWRISRASSSSFSIASSDIARTRRGSKPWNTSSKAGHFASTRLCLSPARKMRRDICDRYQSSGVSQSCRGVFGVGSRSSRAAAPTRVRAASNMGAKGGIAIDRLRCGYSGEIVPPLFGTGCGHACDRRSCAAPPRATSGDMPHASSLIATIVVGIGLAFILGTIANRLRISPLVGYLLAGVVVGPFTPGFIADQQLAPQLAEIGVILLMFGVGLHFSLKDLLAIRAIVIPGAVAQVAASAGLGWTLAWLWGWPGIGGAVFGVALSVASTVVLMRALQERHLVETDRGH